MEFGLDVDILHLSFSFPEVIIIPKGGPGEKSRWDLLFSLISL
jgi:hypothetical protein